MGYNEGFGDQNFTIDAEVSSGPLLNDYFHSFNFIRPVVLDVVCADVTSKMNAEYNNLPYPF